MPAKTWVEIANETGHDIRKSRFAFFAEHKNASDIEVTPEGIPLRAIYVSAEYRNPRTDVPLMGSSPVPQNPHFPTAKIADDGVWLNGALIQGVQSVEARVEYGEVSTLTMTLHVKLER